MKETEKTEETVNSGRGVKEVKEEAHKELVSQVKEEDRSKVKNSEVNSTYSYTYLSSYNNSSDSWNNTSSIDKKWVSIKSLSSSNKSYTKIGGEKNLPKFDGNRGNYEPQLMKLSSHGI